MNTYRISYDKQYDGAAQSVDVLVRAQRYTADSDALTLFNASYNGEAILVASFKNWNSITETSVVQE